MDDPGTEGVSKVSVSVEGTNDDQCEGEDDSKQDQEDYQPGCLTHIIGLPRL